MTDEQKAALAFVQGDGERTFQVIGKPFDAEERRKLDAHPSYVLKLMFDGLSLSPAEARELGEKLIAFADAVDAEFTPEQQQAMLDESAQREHESMTKLAESYRNERHCPPPVRLLDLLDRI